MEHKLIRIGTIGFIIVAMFLTVFAIMNLASQKASASAPSGLTATIASTTNPTVSTSASVIIATSTCTARIITTTAQPIMLTFSDYNNASPTGSFGHWQAASTTVVYDSGQYGCGLVKAYSYATQVLTVTDSR